MRVEKSKLGLDGDGTVDVLDVKCDPEMTGMIIQTYGFLPGYHMNKQYWITILLDGSVSEAKILDFLDNHARHFRITLYIQNINRTISI